MMSKQNCCPKFKVVTELDLVDRLVDRLLHNLVWMVAMKESKNWWKTMTKITFKFYIKKQFNVVWFLTLKTKIAMNISQDIKWSVKAYSTKILMSFVQRGILNANKTEYDPFQLLSFVRVFCTSSNGILMEQSIEFPGKNSFCLFHIDLC